MPWLVPSQGNTGAEALAAPRSAPCRHCLTDNGNTCSAGTRTFPLAWDKQAAAIAAPCSRHRWSSVVGCGGRGEGKASGQTSFRRGCAGCLWLNRAFASTNKPSSEGPGRGGHCSRSYSPGHLWPQPRPTLSHLNRTVQCSHISEDPRAECTKDRIFSREMPSGRTLPEHSLFFSSIWFCN